jgi:hypothetical protein
LKKNALTLADEHVTVRPGVPSSDRETWRPHLGGTSSNAHISHQQHLIPDIASHGASSPSRQPLDSPVDGYAGIAATSSSQESQNARVSQNYETSTPSDDQSHGRRLNVEIRLDSHQCLSGSSLPTPEAGFNIAMDALLSLGTEQTTTPQSSIMPASTPHHEALTQTLRTSPSVAQAQSHNLVANPAAIEVTEAQRLSLIRHYRYKVAPWVGDYFSNIFVDWNN